MAYSTAKKLISINHNGKSEPLPLKYIAADSYKIVPNRRQDLDSYRSGTGYLHRKVLKHRATTIQFETKPMWNKDLAALMTFIRSRYTNEDEKKVNLTYYCPNTDSYKTGDFYIPDVEFPILFIDDALGLVRYDKITLEFVEY